MSNTKFLWNGIKHNGKLYRCSYSQSNCAKVDSQTIAIYARDYGSLPKIEHLEALNDSDLMTDYFEKDRAFIEPSNPLFSQVQEAHNKAVLRRQKHKGSK